MSLDWRGDIVLGQIQGAAMRGVTTWIGLVEERAVELIQSPPKTGKVYVRRGVSHQASAPGEAPASDTGTLVNRRRIDLIAEKLAARLVFTSLHALMLEEGTRNMQPRPFGKRALFETQANGKAAVQAEIKAVTR